MSVGLAAPAGAADRWRDVPMIIGWSSSAIELTTQAATTDGVAFACYSFTNREQRTLNRIDLAISFRDKNGSHLELRGIRRQGQFAPNVPIIGFTGTGGGMRMTKARQCVLLNGRAMTFPSAALHDVVIWVNTLWYDDGSFIIVR